MQLQGEENNDLGFCLSFNCYLFSDNITASAATKVIRELKHEQTAQIYEFTNVDEDVDFEFNLGFSSDQHIAVSGSIVVEEINDASQVSNQLQNENENESVYSMWRLHDGVVSSPIVKCKNSSINKSSSSSSGSRSGGSRKWRIWKSLCRSSSEVEESVYFLRSKKTDSSKGRCKVNAKKVAKVTRTVSSPSSFHELFYMQKKAERKGDKMKSFLPYKQDLLDLC